MAMGKPPQNKNMLPAVLEVLQYKREVKLERETARAWPRNWGWMIDKYKDLKEKLDAITEKSVLIKKEKCRDLRRIDPIPETTNHEYGWLATRPEFQLEIYGSDLFQATRVPEY